jgi:photosystem II stability/assembly factor-like uncharacterized protein
MLVGTEAEGIYLSEDSGETWRQARVPRTVAAIRSLIAVAGQGVAAITGAGLMLSTDGEEYRAVGLSGAINGVVAVDGGLLAATSNGLMRSDGSGIAWKRVPGVLDGNTISAICGHPTHRGVLFASQYGRIYGSADDGRSWTAITESGEFQAVKELVVTEADPGTLVVISQNQGVYGVPVRVGEGRR